MVGIILASHGNFAKGILQSGTMIFGEQENVRAVTLMPSEGPNDFKVKLKEAISSLDNQDEVLFLVDLWGGTPFNQANLMIEEHKDKWAIVAGMNLPMLIEAYAARLSIESAQKIAASILKSAKDGVKVKPEELEPEDTSKVIKDSVQQSNVGMPGEFEYVLARIDSRLLHGQVATAWTKAVHPTRIIVVSDAVAIVRQIIVNNNPATAKGTAIAMAEETPSVPCPLSTKIIADATDAKAASGATAAPIFAQPNAII